jgi:hypothetical protein
MSEQARILVRTWVWEVGEKWEGVSMNYWKAMLLVVD